MAKCFFCEHKIDPTYKEFENIEKFLSPRKKIINRERSGVCAKHQRMLTHEIKYARFLALLPYVSYQGMK
ncbi:30S ribosomal protein S18 [Candidatus Roizmanbacteria bacterium CG_4_10_14_0_8_um_filter_39_9]|uniref:30S ribosomal protein S18 n=1 Tax=Candidatus Roizmanbacteria bacterium CG_4_10_14_0_8_um_filter_39_9 TaxID=1974829 RepID=A0A2M7QC32_9BACT|nr:MAG: 30S ribosomal protein S18 [Candidatus Roizmanbacteria bacterium CG_4_10_14_0_8_um_filter_39_9]